MAERYGHIVVGVDGSLPSMLSLDWATDEAMRRGLSLRIVHAVAPFPYPILASRDELQAYGRDILDEAVARARDRAGRATRAGSAGSSGSAGGDPTGGGRDDSAIDISAHTCDGHMVPILLEEARDAEMLVVGNRGRGGIRGLLLGSVSLQVAAHATGPVVVVRGEADPRGEVVLGVDGPDHAGPAIRFAFEEAAVRGLPLRAVHGYLFPPDLPPGRWPPSVRPLPPELTMIEEAERRDLADSVARYRKEFPDVPCTEDLVARDPVRALVDASSGANLVVVGSRGRGGFAGLVLGSVSHGVIHHADCPVAVVR